MHRMRALGAVSTYIHRQPVHRHIRLTAPLLVDAQLACHNAARLVHSSPQQGPGKLRQQPTMGLHHTGTTYLDVVLHLRIVPVGSEERTAPAPAMVPTPPPATPTVGRVLRTTVPGTAATVVAPVATATATAAASRVSPPATTSRRSVVPALLHRDPRLLLPWVEVGCRQLLQVTVPRGECTRLHVDAHAVN